MKFVKKICILRHVNQKISPAAGYQLFKSQPKIALATDASTSTRCFSLYSYRSMNRNEKMQVSEGLGIEFGIVSVRFT